MRLASRIRGLERAASLRGRSGRCAVCGSPRDARAHGEPFNAPIIGSPPRVVGHVSEVDADRRRGPAPNCSACGRVIVYRIPPPPPARESGGAVPHAAAALRAAGEVA